jgi:hypothetical protein
LIDTQLDMSLRAIILFHLETRLAAGAEHGKVQPVVARRKAPRGMVSVYSARRAAVIA